ncbi:MAG: hypothetical protein K2Y02_04775 [Burkholderiaceae bacterium]|nr:hypothetical protein [Burkholderiaceae bacterium]
MAGFSSNDDFINEVTVNGKFWRNDWNKITGGAAYTAGRWYDFSQLAGTPVANTYAGTALNSVACTDTSGFGLWHGGNVSTDTKHLLNVSAVTAVATGVPAMLMLVDMLLYYPGINMNTATAQTLVTGATLPRYTTGAGVRAFLVSTVASGATAHNISLSYTNQAGTAGRALPVTVAGTVSNTAQHISHSGVAANNYGPFLPLASGDTGMRSAESLTLSASSLAGTAALVLCRPLATLPIVAAAIAGERDLMNQLPSLPRIQDGACLTWLYFAGAATAASSNFYGGADFAWG